MKSGQPIRETQQEKYFSSKIMQKMRQDTSLDLFLFFKRALSEVKGSGLQLRFNKFE